MHVLAALLDREREEGGAPERERTRDAVGVCAEDCLVLKPLMEKSKLSQNFRSSLYQRVQEEM